MSAHGRLDRRAHAALQLLVALGVALPAADGAEEPWRTIPLVEKGNIAEGWAHIGWGQMTPVDQSLRTDCDERGMGLLVYTKEKLGDCQIRVVYRPQDAKSNAGVFIRMDDGILDWIGKPSVAVKREPGGKLAPGMLDKLKAASEAEEGVWYAVHHGYEVQIMDSADAAHRTGAIYSLSTAAAAPAPAKPDAWRTMIITLDGTQVRVELDGKEVTRFDSAAKDNPPRRNWTEPKREAIRPARGYFGLQNHDPGDVVYFQEVSVRPLPRK
jgi:hypothetical protein